MSFFSQLFGDANQRALARLSTRVEAINTLEPTISALSGEALKAKTAEFRERLAKGETLDDIITEAFAVVREASKRTLNKRHFDVQLLGGLVLHQGAVAEMRTGEGKTLVATLPAYLNALAGRGIHVITVNDYLARRDTTWNGEIYDALGLTVGCINHDSSYQYDPTHQDAKDSLDQERDQLGGFRVVHEFLRPVDRRSAYECDITYGTNNEFGFDYLRDNLIYTPEQRVQRGHHYAIIDEVDSILIDEARTPLIISAPDTDSAKAYSDFARAVPSLTAGVDYTIDEKHRTASITDSGIEKMEKRLGITDIYGPTNVHLVHHLQQALTAQVLYQRDRDYVVRDGQVIIVDEFTGRLMPGRRWSEGLHQAVEAKERVKIEQESRTLATITFQNYFRLYTKLSGMTGTARSSAEELHSVYALDVISVPTNQPMIREDLPDRIYKNENGKFTALVREIAERHTNGQPVLIGTISIEKNEQLATLLTAAGVPHEVLNAKNHEREAEIIAQAGRRGAVTVATNLAGRGVDIILGGNPADPVEAEAVRAVGGLHVIGTERHDARRIDDQLRGRAGRQGDPGSSQFFVSTQDELARVFGGDQLHSLMERLGIPEDEVIENSFVSRAIQQAQARIEGQNFDTRKYVLEYDNVVNRHREAVYRIRRTVLDGTDTRALIFEYLTEHLTGLWAYFSAQPQSDEDKSKFNQEFAQALQMVAPFSQETITKAREDIGQFGQVPPPGYLFDALRDLYDQREGEMTAPRLRELERIVLLRTFDEAWREHLTTMEHLRDAVRLRAHGQRDPLVEYKIEAQKLYEQLLHAIRTQVASIIFRVSLNEPSQATPAIPTPKHVTNTGDTSDGPQPAHATEVGRNDPCPCGSGKKYKKCGLLNTEEHRRFSGGGK